MGQVVDTDWPLRCGSLRRDVLQGLTDDGQWAQQLLLGLAVLLAGGGRDGRLKVGLDPTEGKQADNSEMRGD